MATCSNCEKKITGETAVTVCGAPRGAAIGDLCTTCVKGVLTMKIVFKRPSSKVDFKFAQYLPVESEKT